MEVLPAGLKSDETWRAAAKLMPRIAQQLVTERDVDTGHAARDSSALGTALREIEPVLTRIETKIRDGDNVAADIATVRGLVFRANHVRREVDRAVRRTQNKLERLGFGERASRGQTVRRELRRATGRLRAAIRKLETRPSLAGVTQLRRAVAVLLPPSPRGGEQQREASPMRERTVAAITEGEGAGVPAPPPALAPPGPADLAETIEVQFTPEIAEQAATLGNSPVAIYEFVRNEIAFEPYFGSLKGAAATLQTRAGNDYDQASLLIALLRAAGIPARYVRGTALIPTAQILDWLGIKDPAAANPILNTAGISATPVVGMGGAIVHYRVDRVWVAAHVPFGNYRGATGDSTGRAWVPLDPTLKLRNFQPGVDGVTDAVAFDESAFLSTVRPELPAEFYRDQVQSFLTGSLPGTSVAEVPYEGPIDPQLFGLLPASLPYQIAAIAGDFSEPSPALRHGARIELRAGIQLFQTNLILPEVALLRKTISFVPATPADQVIVDSFGGLANTPPFAVDVRPQLKLDGVLEISGAAVPLASGVTLTIGFIEPVAGETGSVTHQFLRAGDYISVNLDAGQTSTDLLIERAARLLAASALAGTPQEDPDELMGELLHIGGLLYFQRVGEANHATAGLFHYMAFHGVQESITTSNLNVLYLFDRPFAVTPGNLSLDAARLQPRRFNIDNDNSDRPALSRLAGFQDSALEHAMWEELVAVESVSTIKALQVASFLGIPLHEFTSSTVGTPITCVADGTTNPVLTCMQRCGVPSSTISGIQSELAAGKQVKTHECRITLNQWQGLGYIAVDPVTQVGAYIISGGLNSVTDTGAATTYLGSRPIIAVDEQAPAAAGFDALPSHVIDAGNVSSVLPTLSLPTALRLHVERLVADGFAVTVSEVVQEIAGREVLLFRVATSGASGGELFALDTLAGGAGTENPPGGLGPDAGNTGDGPGTVTSGDPVNIATGNFIRDDRDFMIPARGFPLLFERTYNSKRSEAGSLGIGWTHTYMDHLVQHVDGTVDWVDSTGARYTFTPDGGGGFVLPSAISVTLEEVSGGFVVKTKDGERQEFDASGLMTARADRNGNGQTLTYDAAGNLETISDGGGRTLTLTSDTSGRIRTVADFTGRTWTYDYDSDGRLIRVESPSDSDTAAIVTTYEYFTGPINANLLKRVIEPNGAVRQISYYTNGRVFAVTDPEGATETFAYDLLKSETRFVDQRGFSTVHRYNEFGNRIETVFPDGAVERLVWDRGLLTARTDTLGNTETFEYDGNRNLIRSVDRTGIETLFEYEPVFNNVTKMTRPGGRVIEYDYDIAGNLTEIRDPENGSTVFAYGNGDGLATSVTNPRGGTTTITYNVAGQPTVRSNEMGATSIVHYDARGNVMDRIDPNGNVTAFEYDLLDRVQRATDAEGFVSTYRHDAVGNLIELLDPRMNRLQFVYDLNGRLVRQVNPDGTVAAFRYDAADNLIAMTNENGHTTTHTYDQRNQLVEERYADGSRWRFGYDSELRLVGRTDSRGFTTEFEYDPAGRPRITRDPAGNETLLEYDAAGLVGRMTDRRGGITTFEYDRLDRLVELRGEGGRVETLDYDANGNVVDRSRYDVSGLAPVPDDPRTLPPERRRRFTAVYDALDRLVSETDPSGGVTTFGRDLKGNRVTVRDPRGKTTTLQYDRLDRVRSIMQPNNAESIVSYDGSGNRVGLKTPRGGMWDFGYDNRNRLVSVSDPLGRTSDFQYDAVGNVLRRTQPDGTWVENSFDPVGRLSHSQGSDGAATSYGLDAAGNLIRGQNDRSLLLRTYDGLNRVIAETVEIDGGAFAGTVSYQYDEEGNLSSVTGPSGRTLTYDHDLAGRLTSAVGAPDGQSALIGFNGFGDRESVSFGNGVTGAFSYDESSRTTEIEYATGTTVARFAYSRDEAGNPIVVDETLAGVTEQLSITHDDVGRPSQVTAALDVNRTETFAYDADGNLTVGGAGHAILYDLADQPITDGTSQYVHDGRGNLRSTLHADGTRTDLTYDPDGRLRAIRDFNGATQTRDVSFLYDALGRLIETTTDGASVRTVHALDNPLAEVAGDGSILTLYTAGPDLDDFFGAISGGAHQYYHRDTVGSVRAVTDSAGTVVAARSYGLFGRLQHASGGAAVPIGFAARPADPGSGLAYMRARWYAPHLGRFLARDPLPITGGTPNPYVYALNKPFRFIDPLGLAPGFLDTVRNVGGGLLDGLASGVTFGVYDGNFFGDLVGADTSSLAYQGTRIVADVGTSIAIGVATGGGGTLLRTAGVSYRAARTIATTARILDLTGNVVQTGRGLIQAADGLARGKPQNVISGLVQAATGGLGVGSGLRAQRYGDDLLTPQRLPQDVNVNPRAPGNSIDGRISTSAAQQTQLRSDVAWAQSQGATDIRVNQQQVNAAGQRVGINRPDLQYTLPGGRRVYVEYDTPTSGRGPGHQERVFANDPSAYDIVLKIIP